MIYGGKCQREIKRILMAMLQITQIDQSTANIGKYNIYQEIILRKRSDMNHFHILKQISNT